MLATGSSLYSEEYYEQIWKMLEDPSVLRMLYIYAAGMIIISILICFFIARSSKLSKKYSFFGFMGIVGVFIVICRAMAKSVDLSPHFMWLGLIGIYGIIIMAIIMSVTSYKKYTSGENRNDQYRQPDEKTGKDDGSWGSEWERRYEEGRNRKEDQSQGYNLNGEYHEHDNGTICLNCGAAVAAGEKICPRCGNQVR